MIQVQIMTLPMNPFKRVTFQNLKPRRYGMHHTQMAVHISSN